MDDRPDALDPALESLGHLLSASLDRLVERPRTLDGTPASEGFGHLPFAAWLVSALRPAVTLGITRRRPAFHAALCQALLREGVPGEAIAVEAAGTTADAGLDRAYPELARRVRLSAGEALPVRDSSVSLLHADDELWREGGERWRRALSPDGVLVLHGASGATMAGRSMVFLHDGGLRVESVGASPASLESLWRIASEGGAGLARLRGRFAFLGERWRQEALAGGRAGDGVGDYDEEHARLIEALRERSRLEAECRRLPALQAEASSAERRLAALQAEHRRLELRLAAATERRRGRRRWLVGARAAGSVTEAAPAESVGRPDTTRDGGRIGSVLFVAGEPDTAGAEFRARRASRICGMTGRRTRWIRIESVGPDDLAGVDLLVLWRATWTTHVETMVGLARAAGALIAFDVDDLVVEPGLARVEIIDGMRTLGVGAEVLAPFFEQLRATLLASDFAIATTDELAARLRMVHPAVYVVPNGFDDDAYDAARLERRARRLASPDGDGLVRIGYAAGTASHQRDFASAAAAIAAVLRARPQARLVLFRRPDGAEMLVTREFPALDPVRAQIEWREMVPVERLAAEIARFDIAICPLEVGNVFCEAKSELKFVEAALAGIPCVASPTGPLSRAIAHGRTGWLAYDDEGWREGLLALVDDAALRDRLGFAAQCAAAWSFGPARTATLWDGMLRGLDDAREAALQHELRIRRGAYAGHGTPARAETDTLFAYDSLRQAAVAVAITSYNYAGFVGEALDSAAAQTLDALELVVVDDASVDGSSERIVGWARANHRRFTRVRVERSRANAGLGPARNAAFASAEARHVMVLDADNRLRPACCASLLALLSREGAAFAYPALRMFGEAAAAIDPAPYHPVRLVGGNFVDATALVAKWAWAAAGGYYDRPDARGWEDFGLWCRLAELGQFGVRHPEELAEYRVHAGSMTNTVTETAANKRALVGFVEGRHPWLRLRSRVEAPRGVVR